MLSRMRWLLGGTAAIWMLNFVYLIAVVALGGEPQSSPLRSAATAALAVLTIIAAVGVAAGESVRRLRAAMDARTPHAVELGRRLEQLRQRPEHPEPVEATVLRFADRRHRRVGA